MSKESDLEQLGFFPVLRPVAEWLYLQGRLIDEADSLNKAATVSILATKLSREQVDQLLARRDPKKSEPDRHELASILGLPQKEAILSSSSKQDLRDVTENLDAEGRVAIAWQHRLRTKEVDDRHLSLGSCARRSRVPAWPTSVFRR